jgi:hypothetical protein
MSSFDEASDALDWIRKAVERTEFVPILGFQLSCLQQYNDVPPTATEIFGSSTQNRELAKQVGRIRAMSQLLSKKRDRRDVSDYLEEFKPNVTEASSELVDDPELTGLLTGVAALAFELTRRWTQDIAERPSPLGGAVYVRTVRAHPTSESDPDEATLYIKRCLNCCARLWEKRNRLNGTEPNSLHVEWVYEKLLLLASKVFEPSKLWQTGDPDASSVDFKDRHRAFIRGRQPRTNWSDSFFPRSQKKPVGVRLSHLLWLQRLLRHLLLCDTRAYRTRDELAFLLSLDDSGHELPDGSADPFEMGLLYDGAATDNATLSNVLQFCEGSETEPRDGKAEPRTPQVFYWALAKRLCLARKKRSSERKASISSFRMGKQVVLSMCLDREMERALAREFKVFRIALPVTVEAKPGGQTKPDWRVAECNAEVGLLGLGYRVSRFLDEDELTSKTFLDQPGPLVVKMFGSPLEALPKTDDERAYSHRLVLDETDLLHSVLQFIPWHAGGLPEFLGKSKLFFFGQNAIRWSDRVPYFLVQGIWPNEYGRGFSGAKDDRAVSIGEPGIFGATALRKLKIPYMAGRATPDDIIRDFICEVSLEARRV